MSCSVPSALSPMSWSFPFCFPCTQGWGGAPCMLLHPTNSLGTDFLTLQDLELPSIPCQAAAWSRLDHQEAGKGTWAEGSCGYFPFAQDQLFFFLNPFQALIRHGNMFSQLEILSPHTPVLLALSKQKMWFSWRTFVFGFKVLIVRKDSGGGGRCWNL